MLPNDITTEEVAITGTPVQVTVATDQVVTIRNEGQSLVRYGSANPPVDGYLSAGEERTFGSAQWVQAVGGRVRARLEVTRGAPSLPGSVVKKTETRLNAADYISGSASASRWSFDLQALVDDMEDTGRGAYFPAAVGTEAKAWQPDDTNILLNSTEDNFSYVFESDGVYGRLAFPTGMTTGALFRVNKDASGVAVSENFKRHPRVVFRDIGVVGNSSPNAMLLDAYNRSIAAERVFLTGMKTGFKLDGYCDMSRLQQVHAEGMTDGGWVYEQQNHGDGLTVDGLFVYRTGGLSLTKVLGGRLSGMVGGYHQFTLCDLELDGYHLEGDADDFTNPLILCEGSKLRFGAGVLYTTTARQAVKIDDSGGTRRKSSVVFSRRCRFLQRLDANNANYGATQQTAVQITSLSDAGRVETEGAVQDIYGHTSSGARLVYESLVPKFASDDSNIQTALDARKAMLGMHVELSKRSGSWEVAAPAPQHLLRTTRRLGTPTLAVASSTTDAEYFTSSLTNGSTYYYRCWQVDTEGRNSTAATEASAAMATGRTMKLSIANLIAPVRLRIARGTSTGTYTHWIEVVVAAPDVEFHDLGTTCAGQTWSTSAVPSVPSTNDTQDGYVARGSQGREVIFASAAPTTGTYSAGAICLHNDAAAGEPAGWTCVTGGSPGTWKAHANIAA